MEEFPLHVVGHAGSVVLDRHQHLAVPLLRPDDDLHVRAAELDAVADEVHEDRGEEIVRQDLERWDLLPYRCSAEISNLLFYDSVEAYRREFRQFCMDPPDCRHVHEDLRAPRDAVVESLSVGLLGALKEVEHEVGVDARDVVRVPDIVRHDVEIQVCLPVRLLQTGDQPVPLLFGLFSIGDVASVHDESPVSPLPEQVCTRNVEEYPPPGRMPDPDLEGESRRWPGRCGSHRFHHPREIIGMREVEYVHADEAFRVVAADPLHRGARISDAPVRVEKYDDIGRVLDERTEMFLALPEDPVEMHQFVALLLKLPGGELQFFVLDLHLFGELLQLFQELLPLCFHPFQSGDLRSDGNDSGDRSLQIPERRFCRVVDPIADLFLKGLGDPGLHDALLVGYDGFPGLRTEEFGFRLPEHLGVRSADHPEHGRVADHEPAPAIGDIDGCRRILADGIEDGVGLREFVRTFDHALLERLVQSLQRLLGTLALCNVDADL
ncbi:hypothetical protein DSECCO2_653550 [anaerobic digester metagenome]